MNSHALDQYVAEMRIAKYSPVTIGDRVALLHRLAVFLDAPLLDARGAHLRDFQSGFSHLSPASVDIYTRHMKAFYDWAHRRRLIAENPAEGLVLPRLQRGRPHPTRAEDLRIIFACTTGALRMAYVLAAFAGLRRGEICRLHRRDVDLTASTATALIHGKGGKDRVVPLVAPVVAEMWAHGLGAGWVVSVAGHPYDPERLSSVSSTHLHGLGLDTTLHSMRHAFATSAARLTHDPLFVRDLLGHGSVATTEIYMQTSMTDAHLRLAGLTTLAEGVLGSRAAIIEESA